MNKTISPCLKLTIIICSALCTSISLISASYGASPPEKDNCEIQYEEAMNYMLGMNVSQIDEKKAVKKLQDLAQAECAEAAAELAIDSYLGWYDPLVPKNKSAAQELALIALADDLENRAAEGRTNAQHKLGSFYSLGLAVPKDNDKSWQLHTQAANAGNAFAQAYIAFYYENQGDLNKAIYWYQKSAEQGDAGAQYRLGLMYLHGKGVPQNTEKATQLFQQSAAQGDKDASIELKQLNVSK